MTIICDMNEYRRVMKEFKVQCTAHAAVMI